MKSDAASLMPAAPGADDAILAALKARTAGLQPGATVDIADLRDRDPYGTDAFALLARRFGLENVGGDIWRLGKAPRWLPDWITTSHEAPYLELFEAAFGHPMAPEFWRWKYRDTARPGMGVWREGKLVGFYGAMPRRTLFLGEPVSTVQIGDVMVHPAERGVMTRSGPFQIAASTFIDRSVGYGRPHLFGFGFPTAKALQIAQKLGLYEEVDQMVELWWTAASSWPARLSRCSPAGAGDNDVIDRLWAAMAPDFAQSILGVRDARYIRERYIEHPTVSYHCLIVRRVMTGTPLGLLVLRPLDTGEFELMDLVGPQHDFAHMVAAARHWSARRGAGRIKAWVTASHARLLASTGASETPLDLVVPANVWSPGPTAESLRGRWWLMAGDTDFR